MAIPGENAPFAPMEQGGTLGYEAHYEISKSMFVTQYHCHDYYEIYIHLRGGEFMGLDDNLYQLKPNQVFIIPPFHMHGLSCTQEMHDYERAYLNLSPEVMDKLGCGQIDLNHFLRSHVTRGHSTYQLGLENTRLFVNSLRQIEGGQNASPVQRIRDYTQMLLIVNMICQVMDLENPEEGGAFSNSIVQEVLAWINMHYTENLNIQDLSRRFGISSSYLSHEFSRFTNRSVYDYILYRRVMLSCQMMMGGDSLNAIAYQCGFNDYSNFLRSFTRVIGVSPSRYRKQRQRYGNA